MTQLPLPPKGFDPEWAAQNNRVIEGRLRGLSTLEQRFTTLSDTVAGDLTAIATLTGTGFLARTADDSWALRTITGTANEITATNGSGVSGNPTLSLPAALTFTGKTVTGGAFNVTTLSTTGTFIAGDSFNDAHEINGTITQRSGAGTVATFGRAGSNGAFLGLTDASGNFVYFGETNGLFEIQTPGSGYSTKFSITSAGLCTAHNSLAITGTLSTTGNATLGDGTGDTHTVNGLLDTRPAGGGLMFRVLETTSGSSRRIQFSNSGTANRIESSTGSGSTTLELAVDNVLVATLAPSSFAVTGTLSTTGNATIGDAGTDTLGSAGRIFSNDAHNNAGGLAGTVQQWFGSATYTPTGTGVANVSSITPAKAQYMRVARVVTISGTVDVSPTAATTTTTFRLSLGVASSLAALSDLAGAAAFIAGSAHGAVVVYADTTNDAAFFSFTSANLLTHSITYSFTYEVL
jgi:hypothetical protein